MKSAKSIMLVVVGVLIGAGGFYVWQKGVLNIFKTQQQYQTSEEVNGQEKQNSPVIPAPTPAEVYQRDYKGEDASTGYALDLQATAGVRVVSPNGGESLCLGKTATILWEATSVQTVSLDIKNTDFTYTIGNFPASKGTVSWKVGDILDIGVLPAGESYQIEVKSKDTGTNYSDASDKVFSVGKCT